MDKASMIVTAKVPWFETVKCFLSIHWRHLVLLLVPLLASPIPIIIGDKASICGYVLIVMAVYWCTEALPLAVTALIPVFFMPLSGLLPTKVVCPLYMKDSSMMFTTAVIIALAMEKVNLHKRFALNVLLMFRGREEWLLLSVLFPSWFLSIWISNAATASMMLPCAEALLLQMEQTQKLSGMNEGEYKDSGNATSRSLPCTTMNGTCALAEKSMEGTHDDSNLKPQTTSVTIETGNTGGKHDVTSIKESAKAFMLAIAYATNVGGVGSLTGTTSNIVLKGVADDIWKKNGYITSPVNYTTWMIIGIPVTVVNFVFLWLWMQLVHVGFRKTFSCLRKRDQIKQKEAELVKELLHKELDNLGPIRFSEMVVIVCFTSVVLLWFFRSPGFMTGWGDLSIFIPGYVDEAVVSCLLAIPLFILPAVSPNSRNSKDSTQKWKPILSWRDVELNLPWGVVFLFGGGFALTEACKTSGLSDWIGDQFLGLSALHDWAMISILCLFTIVLTQVTSNAACCAILMPIVASMAESLKLNPLYFMFPVAISTSSAFGLPVSAPPNAIAYEYKRFTILDMIKNGIVLSILTLFSVVLITMTVGDSYFHFAILPWAGINDALNATQSTLTA